MDECMKLFYVMNGIPQLIVGEGFFDDVSAVSSSFGVFFVRKMYYFPISSSLSKADAAAIAGWMQLEKLLQQQQAAND